MSDGLPPLPPLSDDDDGDLERELRALFAPVPAPTAFRERLKAELLRAARDDERLALVDTGTAPRGSIAPPPASLSDRVRAPLLLLAAHRRASAIVVTALAAAAALLFALKLSGAFGPSSFDSALPPVPTSTPTATVPATATAVPSPTTRRAVALLVRLTATPHPTQTPRPSSTATPQPSATSRPATPVLTPTSAAATATVTRQPVARAAPPAVTFTSTPLPSATSTAVPPAPTSTPIPPATTTRGQPATTGRIPAATETNTAVPPTVTPRPTAALTATSTRVAGASAELSARKGSHARAQRDVQPAVSPTRPSTATPRPTYTPTSAPTATHTPVPTNTPLPTGTATATATHTAVPTVTATPSPAATSTPNAVRIPLARPQAPVPNPDNAVLFSPLSGALAAGQPVSYSLPQTTTLVLPPQAASLTAISPTVSIYPITPTQVTATDAHAIMTQIGVQSVLMSPQQQSDGSIVASVQLDDVPYTLTVYSGFGAPWFSLQSYDTGVGAPSAPRLAGWAAAWLRDHNLAQPDLQLIVAYDNSAYYGQNVAGLPLLRPQAAAISFDGSGVMRSLRYEYVVPGKAIQVAAQQPQAAVTAAIAAGQGLYRGPAPNTFTGIPTITSLSMGYAGVRGPGRDYLEPVYVLNGTVATATGSQGFNLYERTI